MTDTIKSILFVSHPKHLFVEKTNAILKNEFSEPFLAPTHPRLPSGLHPISKDRSYYFYNYFTLNFISFSLFFWQNELVKVNKNHAISQYHVRIYVIE